MKTLPTSVLQMIFKIIPNSKVIIKNIIDPDDNFCSINGLNGERGEALLPLGVSCGEAVLIENFACFLDKDC